MLGMKTSISGAVAGDVNSIYSDNFKDLLISQNLYTLEFHTSKSFIEPSIGNQHLNIFRT